MSSNTRKQLEEWISRKTVTGKILDIGGAQEPLHGRIEFGEDTEVMILDLENPHKKKVDPDIIADLNFPVQGMPIKVGDHMMGIGMPFWLKPNERIGRECFDVVTCFEVTEYLYDPMTALHNMNFFLKKGGRLLISFHFVYPIHAPQGEDCLRYTRYGVQKLLAEAGFEIKEMIPRRASSVQFDLFCMNEGMRALKGFDHREIGVLIEAIKK